MEAGSWGVPSTSGKGLSRRRSARDDGPCSRSPSSRTLTPITSAGSRRGLVRRASARSGTRGRGSARGSGEPTRRSSTGLRARGVPVLRPPAICGGRVDRGRSCRRAGAVSRVARRTGSEQQLDRHSPLARGARDPPGGGHRTRRRGRPLAPRGRTPPRRRPQGRASREPDLVFARVPGRGRARRASLSSPTGYAIGSVTRTRATLAALGCRGSARLAHGPGRGHHRDDGRNVARRDLSARRR